MYKTKLTIFTLCSHFAAILCLGDSNLSDPLTLQKIFSASIDRANLKHKIDDGIERLYFLGIGEPYSGWASRTDDGHLKSLSCIKKGVLEGPNIEWWKNGIKKTEGQFKNGKKDGEWTSRFLDGQKEYEVSYKDGKREGVWTSWYKNGQVSEEGNYTNGLRNGSWSFWFKDGKKDKVGYYKSGKRDGNWTTYIYDYVGLRDDVDRICRLNDIRVKISDGNVSEQEVYNGLLPEDYWGEYDDQELSLTRIKTSWKNGRKNGIIECWGWSAHAFHLLYKSYKSKGVKVDEDLLIKTIETKLLVGSYISGMKHGRWSWWWATNSPQKKLAIVENYKSGNHHGLYVIYDKNGKEEYRETPKDGKVIK
jgi:antitoxin component YwqK of YwqJK toxin-antitoxin module